MPASSVIEGEHSFASWNSESNSSVRHRVPACEDESMYSPSAWLVPSPMAPSSPPADGRRQAEPVVTNNELTISPDSRTPRPSAVQPHLHIPIHSSSQVAIQTHTSSNHIINHRQDVRPAVNTSASFVASSVTSAHRNNIGTSVSSAPATSSQHGLTQPITKRPRTSSQIFSSPNELVAHYGIPQFLPPAPSTIPRRVQQRQQTHIQSPPDFELLRQNYLNMLAQQPADNHSVAEDKMNPVQTVSPADLSASAATTEEAQALFANTPVIPPTPSDLLSTSDDFTSPLSDFMTSPDMQFTPGSEFLSSPAYTPFEDFLTTPVINDQDEMFSGPLIEGYSDMPLFGGYSESAAPEKPSIPQEVLDKLIPMSPMTPALTDVSSPAINPSSIYPSPRLAVDKSLLPPPSPTLQPSSRRRSSATGTRKGVTPDVLLDEAAPTQPRKYLFPSATSRKDLPSVFAKKRARSQALGDEEDELDPLPPDASEREQIEYKRRQNTVAARRSRRRKLEFQQELMANNERLTREVDVWKTRAELFKNLLQVHGIPVPETFES